MALVHMFLFRPAPVVDPRYSDPAFRKEQAKRYLSYLDGTGEFTAEELQLIPTQCYHEIQDIYDWNSSTPIERAVYRVCHPLFSRLPDDQKSTVRICGASMVSLGAIFFAGYSRNDKLVVITLIFFIAVLCREMCRKKSTKE